jgi:ATP-dependent Clp protease ATP-binding subunit ClpC
MADTLDRFTRRARQSLTLAQEEAQRLHHNYIGTEHLLVGLIRVDNSVASKILRSLGVTTRRVQELVEQTVGYGHRTGTTGEKLGLTRRTKRVLELAVNEARKLGHHYIDTAHLLLGLVQQDDGMAVEILRRLGVSAEVIRRETTKTIHQMPSRELAQPTPQTSSSSSSKSKGSVLDQVATDLTALAREDKLDPVIGRETEIERVIQILSRRTKNNPALIGEPGVGKTAIVEGIAQKIIAQDIPYPLRNKQLWQLDVGSLVAGTMYRGQFEERLKKVIDELKNSDSILFIDEVHMLVGAGSAGSSVDAANILKPALSRGELQCIGATTMEEYRKHIESDAALERRFQPVVVNEPSTDESIAILRGIRERYEQHHQLRITDQAVEMAVKLASRYITERYLPDKAIDLIDEGSARVRMYKSPTQIRLRETQAQLKEVRSERERAVADRKYDVADSLRLHEMELERETERLNRQWSLEDDLEVQGEDIAELVSMWTGIPLTSLHQEESERLLQMEEALHERVVGQDDAISAVSKAVRRARSGLKDPNRPIGSFIFIGPTGVGKTELAKALAEFMFGEEDALLQLDMSEFGERHTVARLVGAPPGYVGYDDAGQLTEAVRRRPYRVICFDEIDKAHPEAFGMLLQILEEGHLSDARGRTVDFRNTIIIMTSNVGAEALRKGPLGIPGTHRMSEFRAGGFENELKRLFRPEFLNRIDQIIVFRTLSMEETQEIVDLELAKIQERLKDQDIGLEATSEAKTYLAQEGYSEEFGARNLRRTVQRAIEDQLSEGILSGEFSEGAQIVIRLEDGEIVLDNGHQETEPPLLEAIVNV